MRSKVIAACAVLLAGVTTALAPPAAAAGVFPGAGYKLTGVRTLTLTFTMPKVDCAGANGNDIGFGLFAPDLEWEVAASVLCRHGKAQGFLDAGKHGQGGGIGGGGIAAPGHRIQLTLAHDNGRTRLTVRDLTAHQSNAVTTDEDTSAAAAGAVGFRAVPRFPDLTMGLVANGGPFADLDHVRHTQVRDGVKQIGTGFPWADDTHFTLYFKHH